MVSFAVFTAYHSGSASATRRGERVRFREQKNPGSRRQHASGVTRRLILVQDIWGVGALFLPFGCHVALRVADPYEGESVGVDGSSGQDSLVFESPGA